MKKVLIIQADFFPAKNYGGPPVSIKNLCLALDGLFDFYIVTQNKELHEKEPLLANNNIWHYMWNINVKYLNAKDFFPYKFNKIVSEIRPSTLYLQSFFSFKIVIPTILYAKKNKVKLIIAPRGELLSGALKKKWKKIPYIYFMKLILPKNTLFQGTSAEEIKSLKFFFPKWDNIFLKNLPSPIDLQSSYHKKKNNTTKFIFLSRIVKKKNLKFALDILKDISENIIFDIYGPIEDLNYWKQCSELIASMPENISINYCGVVSNEDVTKVFNQYDFFLFPTYSENYGHVIVEAMVSNCPVIISDNTPWNDINIVKSGFALPLSEKELFVNAINKAIKMDQQEYNKLIMNNRRFVREFVYDDVSVEMYRELF
ncbi:glycosyltransferase, group 1 family protein [Enterococcus casseliflavus ATCC 12755]|uniref:Glycosyltransferase, group 1 family protein n=1 Tax=Enterococcus casseliflavus ATCC 12755 TaxID=888066 RepID=F0EKC9_ENTCA|nr:glycosyltransferase [Enterococcus casseliflavus]EGC69453.1 glycosyltransferase, group 1 family protein [Enterococcus casseliflavus ATCC 12755]